MALVTAVLLWILAVLLIVVGIAGTVIPVLPGTPLVLVGLIIAAWIDGFTRIGFWTLGGIGVIMLLSLMVDFVASTLGAKRAGASRLAIVLAMVGAVVGIFLGIIGILVGPFIGAVAGEYIHQHDLIKAGKVGVGTWIGMAVGTAAKLALAFSMVGIFALAYVL